MIKGTRMMMKHGGGGGLPAGYSEVDYITPASSGAYIDLGWYPTTWTAFDAYMTIAPLRKANFGVSDVVPTSTNSQQILNLGFSLVDNWSNDRWLGFAQSGTYEWNNDLYSYSQYTDIRNNLHHHVVDLEKYLSRMSTSQDFSSEYAVDGTTIKSGFWDNVLPSGKQTYTGINRDVFLFALNVNGSASAAGVSKCGRLRFCTLQGDVANFIPCINGNGYAGMYDTVSRTFHGAASGTINYGSII